MPGTRETAAQGSIVRTAGQDLRRRRVGGPYSLPTPISTRSGAVEGWWRGYRTTAPVRGCHGACPSRLSVPRPCTCATCRRAREGRDGTTLGMITHGDQFPGGGALVRNARPTAKCISVYVEDRARVRTGPGSTSWRSRVPSITRFRRRGSSPSHRSGGLAGLSPACRLR
jgi:hypothetical protein